MTPASPSKPGAGGETDPAGALVFALARLGPAGRHVAVGLDLLRSLGVGPAYRRLRGPAAPAGVAAQDGLDPAHAAIWRDAAREIGAEVVDVSDGFLTIRRGDAVTRVWNHWTMLDDAVTLRFGLDKLLVHRILEAAGIPVPDHLEFTMRELSRAREFLARETPPCVVKPVNSSGGSGTTSGVGSLSQLRRASLRAGRIDRRLLVERQVPGDAYRLLYLDGELLDAVRRLPPSVTGDGRSSVEALIAAENARRRRAYPGRRLSPLLVDLECVLTLADAGLDVASVLPRGRRVTVKRVVSQNSPEENEGVRGAVCGELIAEGAAAAAAVGLRLAGVDVVTSDAGMPLSATGGVVLEVNGPPGLHYHYHVRQPERATRVAVPILRALLEDSLSGGGASRSPHPRLGWFPRPPGRRATA